MTIQRSLNCEDLTYIFKTRMARKAYDLFPLNLHSYRDGKTIRNTGMENDQIRLFRSWEKRVRESNDIILDDLWTKRIDNIEKFDPEELYDILHSFYYMEEFHEILRTIYQFNLDTLIDSLEPNQVKKEYKEDFLTTTQEAALLMVKRAFAYYDELAKMLEFVYIQCGFAIADCYKLPKSEFVELIKKWLPELIKD